MQPDKYTIKELIVDPAFIQWAKGPESPDDNDWLAWAALSKENERLIQEAKRLVLDLNEDRDAPGTDELEHLWARINTSIDITEQKGLPQRGFFGGRFVALYKVAASIAVLLLTGVLFWLVVEPGKTKLHTQYGNNRTVILPDSSVVVLNGNSTIKYASSWEGKEREVWLEGEAYFSVDHKPDSRKFIVHTPDLDVQVVGTKFNVNTYREKTRVVLTSGKVKLRMHNMIMDMAPGDLVDFSTETKKIEKKEVEAPKYSSWVNKEFVFEATSLEEIAHVLEDNYGYQVTFSDPALTKLSFTGTYNSENTDLLLTMIQKSFQLSVRKSGNHITISH